MNQQKKELPTKIAKKCIVCGDAARVYLHKQAPDGRAVRVSSCATCGLIENYWRLLNAKVHAIVQRELERQADDKPRIIAPR